MNHLVVGKIPMEIIHRCPFRFAISYSNLIYFLLFIINGNFLCRAMQNIVVLVVE